MVIYWFGFIDDLQQSTADLVLVDAFPSPQDIIQLPWLSVPSDLLPTVINDCGHERDVTCAVADLELLE